MGKRRCRPGAHRAGRAVPVHPALSATITDALSVGGTEAGITALRVATRLELAQPLLAAVETVVEHAELTTLSGLDAALPRASLVLTRTAVRIAEALVSKRRELTALNRDAYLPDLACRATTSPPTWPRPAAAPKA